MHQASAAWGRDGRNGMFFKPHYAFGSASNPALSHLAARVIRIQTPLPDDLEIAGAIITVDHAGQLRISTRCQMAAANVVCLAATRQTGRHICTASGSARSMSF